MRHIFVLIGKAGVGKTSIAKQVVADSYDLVSPVGATTRKPRAGEKDRVDYEFLTEQAFESYECTDVFLETVTYKGNRYGYMKYSIMNCLQNGKDLLIILTPEGHRAFKEYFKDNPDVKVTPIAIHPASEEERLENLKQRGSEANEDDEINLKGYKGWSVCNYDLDTSVRQVKMVIEEARKGLETSVRQVKKIIEEVRKS